MDSILFYLKESPLPRQMVFSNGSLYWIDANNYAVIQMHVQPNMEEKNGQMGNTERQLRVAMSHHDPIIAIGVMTHDKLVNGN